MTAILILALTETVSNAIISVTPKKYTKSIQVNTSPPLALTDPDQGFNRW